MIQMPRRNVTRFFIPLIDVLILLFCIFLLMEFNSESKVSDQSVDFEKQAQDYEGVMSELLQRRKELHQYEELKPLLVEVDKLREENERLRNASQRNLQDNAYVRILDIDAKDGSLSFFDVARPDQPIRIKNAQSAQALIERHTKEAAGRQLYYYFMYPRTRSVYPLFGQEQEYQRWFKKAANSLVKVGS
jgi:hypothetical protein